MEKFKISDRVRRLPFTITIARDSSSALEQGDGETQTTTLSSRGCIGTVKAIREETTLAPQQSRAKSIMIHVLWDNGTLAYHGPDALEVVQ